MTDPKIRGDPDDPLVRFQAEFAELIRRYEGMLEVSGEQASALLIETLDSVRILYDLEVDVIDVGGGIVGIVFGPEEQVGWLGAPRQGEFHDIDPQAFEEQAETGVRVHRTGNSFSVYVEGYDDN